MPLTNMGTFESLEWLSRFLDETPGDFEVGGRPRQVPNACWSRVKPTPPPNPNFCYGRRKWLPN